MMIAGIVINTKVGIAQMQIEAQKELDSLFGAGNIAIQINEPEDKVWKVRIYRCYPEGEQYEVPSPSWPNDESEIYYRDAFILAGNQGKKVVDFGPMPFVSCGFKYYLAESTFLYYWNAAAKDLGFSKLKDVEFINDPLCFEVIMKY